MRLPFPRPRGKVPEGRKGRLRQRRSRLDKVDKVRQLAERHFAIDMAVLIEQRVRELAIAKAAAETRHFLAIQFAITGSDSTHTLGGDIAGNVCIHFNENKSPRSAVPFV